MATHRWKIDMKGLLLAVVVLMAHPSIASANELARWQAVQALITITDSYFDWCNAKTVDCIKMLTIAEREAFNVFLRLDRPWVQWRVNSPRDMYVIHLDLLGSCIKESRNDPSKRKILKERCTRAVAGMMTSLRMLEAEVESDRESEAAESVEPEGNQR